MGKDKRRNWNVKKSIYAVIKRIFDIIFSLIGIIIFSPILIIIAIAIKLDSKGPAIFKQSRTGKYGENFNLWKFRSMAFDNDVRDFSKADKITRVGAFIRKTSLDELPQLFNIFLGKMSFIGPRPWITDYYDNMNEEQRHRFDVTPGLTGLAQAKGRNSISIFEKIGYDLEYVDNFSLIEDIKIIFLTIKVVLTKEDISIGKSTIQNELNDLMIQDLPILKEDALAVELPYRSYKWGKSF